MINNFPLIADKRFCYFIDKSMKDKNGDYSPVIIVEEEDGYYQTDWNFGHDFACVQEFVNIRNTRLGLSQEEVDSIVVSSLRHSLSRNDSSF